MREQISQYLTDIYNGVPISIYEGLFSILFIGLVTILAFYGLKKGIRMFFVLFLAEYLFLIFCSTILFRITTETRKYNINPLWSYTANGIDWKNVLIAEVIMNIVIFLPIGFSSGIILRKSSLFKIIIVGVCISSFIEISQFLFKKGLFEIDDVIHNTLGCMIGYGICSLARYGYERFSKRSVGVL